MIPLAEIDSAAKLLNVPAETIEKDYVISWFLLALTRDPLMKNIIFYGGTAIKRIYFGEHRFSEDIDFISKKYFSPDVLLELLNEALLYIKNATNIVASVRESMTVANKNRAQFFIDYAGYDEIVGAPKEIRVDFSMQMDLFGSNKPCKIIKSYSDLEIQNNEINVTTLNTILANKTGMLLDSTRNEPRDLFDVWFLSNRKDKFDYNKEEIKKTIQQKYGFIPSLSTLKLYLKSENLKKQWNYRLAKQMAEVPDINSVIKDVEQWFEKTFST